MEDVKLYRTKRQIPAKDDEANILMRPTRGADCLNRKIIIVRSSSSSSSSSSRLVLTKKLLINAYLLNS